MLALAGRLYGWDAFDRSGYTFVICAWRTMMQQAGREVRGRFERLFEVEVTEPMSDFKNLQQEWRLLFSGQS